MTEQRPLIRVLGWPMSAGRNPYNKLLYEHLGALGVVATSPTVWRVMFGSYDVLHVHWPNFDWPRRRLRPWKAMRLLLRAFAVLAMLLTVRLRGKRTIWTVHNLREHDARFPRFARIYDSCLASLVHGHIALTAEGRELAERRFPVLRRRPAFVIRHGHYAGAYPTAVSRPDARERLGIPEDARVALLMGSVRPYKRVVELLSGLASASLPSILVVIAGPPFDAEYRDAVQRAGAYRAVRLELAPVDDARVVDFLCAADLFLAPAREMLNSGSLLLALSYGLPVLAHDSAASRDAESLFGSLLVHRYVGELSAERLTAVLREVENVPRRPPPVSALAETEWGAIARQTRDAFHKVLTST